MPRSSKKSTEELQALICSLFNSTHTLSLATLSEDRLPEASLVPFLYYDDQFWIFVSQLSSHTQHLLKQRKGSALIYANEAEPKNYFSIERVSFLFDVAVEEKNREQILDLMSAKLGDTVSLIRQLGDFYLLSLRPQQGRFIAGFGQAFDIEFPDLSLRHINPQQVEPKREGQ